jgi:hypothetical protein
MRPAHLTTVLNKEFHSATEGQHTPVMLWGAPGVGKSQIVAQVAQLNQVPMIDIRLSQMEPSDLRGIPFRNNDQVEWAIPSMLPNVKDHGETGILFLDEITSAAPSVSAAAYQLILDRRLGQYEIPEGWAILDAGNRQGDRGITYSMPAPLANRFSHYDVDVNLDDWVAWAYEHDIDNRIIAFLRFRPDLIFDFDAAQNPMAFPSPRSWEFTHRALQKFMSHHDVLLETLQACVGPAAGVELNAFIANLDQMPNIQDILEGKQVPVPEEIDLQYAIAAALVGQAIRIKDANNEIHTLGNILNYASQFPQREMGVMMISDMHRAIGEKIFALPEFASWADSVADIMLFD